MSDREKLNAVKTAFRQAVQSFAPKEDARDPRWNKFINEVTKVIVRVDGTIY